MTIKKARRGVSLWRGIALGTSIGSILTSLNSLELNLKPFHFAHSLKESLGITLNKKNINEKKKELLEVVKLEVANTNELIKLLNEVLSMLRIKKRVVLLKYSFFKKIIADRFSRIFYDDETRRLGDENFRMRLHQQIHQITTSIMDVIEYVHSIEKFEELKSLKYKYKKGVEEAVDIWSVGYSETAIFIIGRTIEMLLDDLLKKLMKTGKIDKINLKDTKYQDKIGKLKHLKIINEQEWHDLNSIRIDRNERGHPIYKKTKKMEAQLVISKSILIIKKLQRKA